jgi:hypothetical protein
MLLRRYHEEPSEPKEIMPKPEDVKPEDADAKVKAEKPAKRKSRKASS